MSYGCERAVLLVVVGGSVAACGWVLYWYSRLPGVHYYRAGLANGIELERRRADRTTDERGA